MLATLRKAEYAELLVLFFIQAAAMAIWFVPLGTVLDANGLHTIKPFAFAANAVASFISPLIFGAMADRHIAPARVLRWLSLTTAVMLSIIATAIHYHVNPWLILGIIQVYALAYTPMFSITTALVLARLQNAKREFGPVRMLATLGWMGGAILIGWLNLDHSMLTGYIGAAVWLLVAGFTYYLPALEVPASSEKLSWHERLGLDALTLLKKPDLRVVVLTTTLLNIPLCAFFPYTPTHLQALHFSHTSAWMSLGQTTEILGMIMLSWLLHHYGFRKLFLAGLFLSCLRFSLAACNTQATLLLSLICHGASFVLVYIVAQLYMEQHIDPQWRSRAQAMLSFLNGGVGNIIGYLGTGWWFAACTLQQKTHWTLFWGVLAGIMALVAIHFFRSFKETTPSNSL
jgi:nucleoside transporter